jgi:hypothetical protein
MDSDLGFDSLESQLSILCDAKHPDRSRGALHLLLHRWTADQAFNASLPFKDADSLDVMIERLRLPRCYPYDCGRWQHIPARMDVLQDGLGKSGNILTGMLLKCGAEDSRQKLYATLQNSKRPGPALRCGMTLRAKPHLAFLHSPKVRWREFWKW